MKLEHAIAALCLAVTMFTAFSAPAVTQQPFTNFSNVVSGQANNLLGTKTNGAMPVSWGQSSIGMNQLQNIFSQNPNFSQFNIQFPNGANWSISPQSIQSFYNDYIAQAKSSGFGNNPPALNFSSLPGAVSSMAKNSVTVPINNAIGSMQQQTQQMLDQIYYEKYHFMDGWPVWIQKIVTAICIGFGIIWDFAVDQIKSWF